MRNKLATLYQLNPLSFLCLSLRAPHPEEVIERDGSKDIENEIAPEDSIISPAIAPLNLPPSEILIC